MRAVPIRCEPAGQPCMGRARLGGTRISPVEWQISIGTRYRMGTCVSGVRACGRASRASVWGGGPPMATSIKSGLKRRRRR